MARRRYRRRRRIARYKRTGIFIAGTGIAIGLAAMILWPELKKLFQTPLIKVGVPTITPSDGGIDPMYVDSLPVYANLLRGI